MKIKYIFFFFCLLPLAVSAQNGLVTNYHGNGKVESEMFYIKGIIDGTARWYYYYGILKEERNYVLGKLNGWQKTYYENGAPKVENYFNDGKRDGIAKEFYINGGLKTYYHFDNGLLKEKRSFSYDSTLKIPKIVLVDKKGNRKEITGQDTSKQHAKVNFINTTADSSANDSVYFIAVNEYPEPLDGMKSIYDRIYLLEAFKQEKVNGDMIIKIYVNENGNVDRSICLKGFNPSSDNLVNDIVMKTKFKPGRKNGTPVKAQKNLYLNFNGIPN